MWNWFFGVRAEPPQGTSTTAAASATINAIQHLADQEEMLEKKRALLERRIAEHLQSAKDWNVKGNKPRALQALKQKKILEAQLDSLNNMIQRVVEQRFMLESQRTTVEVVSGLHKAALTAKDNMKAIGVDKVDQVMDDINDANEQMSQLHAALANPTGAAADIDEDELLGQLDEMDELDEAELNNQAKAPAQKKATHAPAHKGEEAEHGELPAAPMRKVAANSKAKAKAAAPAGKTVEQRELEGMEEELAA